MTGGDRADTETLDGVSMHNRWRSCKSLAGARKLVDYMISHPSLDWVPIMDEAQKGNMRFGRALLDREVDFYESVADLIAEQDGLVYIRKEKNP